MTRLLLLFFDLHHGAIHKTRGKGGLVSAGQTHAALQSLMRMFTSKHFKSTPLPALKPIPLHFVELCIGMGKGRAAKEGLTFM